MARELQVTYTTAAASLYAIVRRTSDGYAWNGTAFEAWTNTNVGTYDIPLTDRGGDLYDADFPTAIAAGSYLIVYYVQAGGSPAVADEVLRNQRRQWDGAALVEDSDIAVGAYALTTLASVKRRLEIDDTDSDTFLSELINQVSAEVETVCGRQFKARDRRDWINGAGQREIRLPNFPVQHVSRIAFGAGNALSVTFAAGSNIRATAGIYRDPESADAGGLRLQSVNASGVATTTTLSFAAYPSVSTLAAAVNAVSGWTATTLSNQPTADLHASAGGSALGRAVTFTYPDLSEFAFRLDYAKGLVRFDHNASAWWGWCGGGANRYRMTGVPDGDWGSRMPHDFQGVLVQYRAGYETVPADVMMVTNVLVQDAYHSATIGLGVTEMKLGPGTLKFSDSQKDMVRESLENYIDHSQFIGGVR